MTPYGNPSHLYHCLLDEQPYYLAPPRRLLGEDGDEAAVVNPACWFSWHGELPAHLAARVEATEEFLPAEQIVWVEDVARMAIWPFWVGPEYFPYLSSMEPGGRAPEHLPVHVRWTLAQAGVLVEPEYADRRKLEWEDQVQDYARAYQGGYVTVPGLIHPFHLGALRRYYRHRTRKGFYEVGDPQVRRRFHKHNDELARYFHRQLTPAVSQIACAMLKPSYVYFVSYLSGAVLEKHTDRPQCDYSITMCIDATPEPLAQSPWPIKLETEAGEASIYQHIGDALLYRGCAVAHSRDRLEDGFTSTSLLFHYVDESFAGDLN